MCVCVCTYREERKKQKIRLTDNASFLIFGPRHEDLLTISVDMLVEQTI